MNNSNEKQFPPLLGMGVMVYTARKYIKEGKKDEKLAGFLNMISFKDLIEIQIYLVSLYYLFTEQYKVSRAIDETRLIAQDLSKFTRNDAEAFDLFNKGLEKNSTAMIEKATKLAPHVPIYWMELMKIYEKKGKFLEASNIQLKLFNLKNREKGEFAIVQDCITSSLKDWKKGALFSYFSTEEDPMTQLISLASASSIYLKGESCQLPKKELVKGLDDAQTLFEWISALASLINHAQRIYLYDKEFEMQVTESLTVLLGFTPEALGEIQTPNFLSPFLRTQKWMEIMGMDILRFRAMKSIKEAIYVHNDGDIGNDDPKSHGWLSRDTDKIFKSGRKHEEQEISFAEEIVEHIEVHFGEVDKILHDTKQDKYHIDTYILPPTKERNYGIMVTSGMSQYPMNVRPGSSGEEHAEIFMQFPPDWPLPIKELKQDDYSWAFGHLYEFARYVHQRNTFFWHGQVIDLHQPLGENTTMTGYIIAHPLGLPESFGTLELKEGNTIHFLQLIPAYAEEMDFLEVKGWDALYSKFRDNNVTGIFDIKRLNTCLTSTQEPFICTEEKIPSFMEEVFQRSSDSVVKNFMKDLRTSRDEKEKMIKMKALLNKFPPEFHDVLNFIQKVPNHDAQVKIFDEYFHGKRGEPKLILKALGDLTEFFPTEEYIWKRFVQGHFQIMVSPPELISLIEKLEKSVEQDPNSPFKVGLLGLAYMGVGEQEKAMKHYERQLEINPEDVDLLKEISLGYHMKGDKANAIEWLKKFMKARPDDDGAKHLLKLYKSGKMF